jgi:hypothetical protein
MESLSAGRYRKRPVVIEALRYEGDKNLRAALAFIGTPDVVLPRVVNPAVPIETLEGRMLARAGDWIVRGVQGEFYPVKPDIFEQTYEAVDV